MKSIRITLFLMMASIILIVSGCASTKASWDKLTPDEQARVVVSGMQKQLDTLFEVGLDYVVVHPQYKDKWWKEILPAFDKANKMLRTIEEAARLGTMTPERALSQAGPLIQAVNNMLVSIGAIGGGK